MCLFLSGRKRTLRIQHVGIRESMGNDLAMFNLLVMHVEQIWSSKFAYTKGIKSLKKGRRTYLHDNLLD